MAQRKMEFYVQDQGSGIDPALEKFIFDKYARVKSGEDQLSGTGLGLYFCRLAVKAHRGRIGVRKPPGGGSCFYFTLPVV